jgi:vacuolar-type H+-ATPase subunit I/STV1
MKKNIFEKLGLVEYEESEVPETTDSFDQSMELDGAVVSSIEGLDMDEILSVDSIYDKCGLADKSKSIFKVDEFKNALPNDIPNESKRKSVVGVITVSGLSLDILISDAETRISALRMTLDSFSTETINMVSENDAEIVELESKINELKQKNNDRKKAQEVQEMLITEEVKKIEDIVRFINQ